MECSGFFPVTAGRSRRPDAGAVLEGPAGWAVSSGRGGVQRHTDTLALIACGTVRWAADGAVSEAAMDRFAARFRRDGETALAGLDGDFALFALHRSEPRALVAADRLGRRPVYYAEAPAGVAVSTRLEWLIAQAGVDTALDPQALYHYLYAHAIAAPRTVYRGVRRLLPGEALLIDAGRARLISVWRPRYDEPRKGDPVEGGNAFRALVERAVSRCVDGRPVGAFLSGGTDSSTVAGMLGRVTGAAPRTFSIGFDAKGYDETVFARTAARHFGAEHHEYVVTPADVADAIPQVAAAYDQPFGNASVVPAYYCARLAHDAGVTLLLGGDGGDELFGGNARYAKQWIFSLYERLPGALRGGVVEPLALRLPSVGPLRKVRSYVEQARLPLAERSEAYNLLTRLGIANVLTDGFLAEVNIDEPLRLTREAMAAPGANTHVNRMLARDLRFTVADDDLVKVRGACALAGVDSAFPLLDDDLVRFSLTLPPSWKLRRTRLRPFFKEALRDFLPPEVIRKEKHGFGLPFGIWLAEDRRLRELAGDSLLGLKTRDIVRATFLDAILDRWLAAHPAYYGTLVWVLMMLEQWFQTRRRASKENGVPAAFGAL